MELSLQRSDVMVSSEVRDKPVIKCTYREYDIVTKNRVTKVFSNKVIMGDVLNALLHEDYELERFFENFGIVNTSVISVTPMKEEIPLIEEEKEKVKKIKLAKIPNPMQRRWMILHELPDDRDITQKE